MTPKVSLVIPVYNGSDYLAEALESAFAQTYKNIEIIVVNDGSNDGGATERLAQSYGDRIRYFSKPNGGVATALNTALAQMEGDYFSWLSHDDLYFPEKIEAQIQRLATVENPERTILYSDFALFTTDASRITPIRLPEVASEDFRYFLTLSRVNGCTLLIPRAAFAECGTFDEKLRTTQDYDLWFRLASRYRFVHVDQVLMKSRQHPGQDTNRIRSTAMIESDDLMVHFLTDLSAEEMARGTGLSAGKAYAQAALSYTQRGLPRAAALASTLAKRHLGAAGLADAASCLMLLLQAKWTSLKANIRMSMRRGG